ncbi:MAG: DUF3108 domain-containing protein [Acidobacteria bacterium]|nr:MAG: DUF3108 domain-containing protein [Acidobacteriota bacterium]
MRNCQSWIALAIFLIPMVASDGAVRSLENRPPPFSPGETLTYDVNWSVFPAGKVTATLSRNQRGHGNFYLVTTTANSQGFASLLYKVDDKFQSVFNSETLCSIQIFKQINEGRRHKITKITFDHDRRVAILDERDAEGGHDPPKLDEHEIPSCAQDIITAFYYLRSQPLHVGQKLKLAINDGSKTKVVVAAVTERRKIQTPLGDREALRVEPSVFGNLYEEKKGKIVIWFSDDEYHFPLRIRASLKLGAITGTLTSISPAPSGYSPSPKSEKSQGAEAFK